MKIYLDFDDTILDTGGFIKELIQVFGEFGFAEKDFYENYKKTKAKVGDFDLDTIFEFYAALGDFDKIGARKKADAIFAGMDTFVHDDFYAFAREFGKEKLSMLSFGTTPSQRRKIESSKVAPYFGEIIVTPRSKEKDFQEILKRHPEKKLFFVEDKADQIDLVKAAAPRVVTMKIERPSGRYIESKSNLADHIVKDFNGVADIIKNNL